jgi:2-oxoglutarate dehydrogenase E1 component
MGSWTFVEPYLEWVLDHAGSKVKRPRYVGRPAAASPAVGQMSKHLAQLQAFLDDAFAEKAASKGAAVAA